MIYRFFAMLFFSFISLLFSSFSFASQGTSAPQVTMVKKAMPAVVGIGLDRKSRIGYRFSGDNSFWEEFQKQYKREQGEFRKKGKPQWDTDRDSFKPEDIEVSGSGFIVDKDGTIITAEHVVNGHRTVYITTWDSKVYRASVTKSSKEHDVAILKVEGGDVNFPVMPMGDSDKLEIAEPVFGIGNPFGITFTVTSGIVSALNRQLGDGSAPNLIQTDAPLNPGNSGGPLINMNGEVIGISHQIYSPGKGTDGRAFNVGLAFAVPINSARQLMLSTADSPGSAVYIGISLTQLGGKVAVEDVEEGSPAAAGGMKPGDVILAVDSSNISSKEQIIRILKTKKPGEALAVKISRHGKAQQLTIVVAGKKR